MQTRILVTTLCAVMAIGGTIAHAEFHVSDLVYVPVVAHTAGANDSLWSSDMMISNIEAEDSIDVAMVFLPSGLRNNSYLFSDRTQWVGGREADSFGIIDERLADIPPGGSVVLEDVVEAYWPTHSGLNGQGALVVFSYLADSLEDDGSREYRNMTVSSRTFNTATLWEPDPENDGEFLESEVTYGQLLNGVPWYNLADSAFVSDQGDFSYLLLDGARDDSRLRALRHAGRPRGWPCCSRARGRAAAAGRASCPMRGALTSGIRPPPPRATTWHLHVVRLWRRAWMRPRWPRSSAGPRAGSRPDA